jgi:hypothetical protein
MVFLQTRYPVVVSPGVLKNLDDCLKPNPDPGFAKSGLNPVIQAQEFTVIIFLDLKLEKALGGNSSLQ